MCEYGRSVHHIASHIHQQVTQHSTDHVQHLLHSGVCVCVFVCGVVLFFIFITHGSTYDVVHDCYGCMYHNHATTTDLHT